MSQITPQLHPTDPPFAAPHRSHAMQTFAAALSIAVLAILLRLPACGESLWVDELHSAWAVWGEWQEIAGRAERGNQTPWYFYALWCWRHWVGDSELTLRLPSVLATALAAAVLVAGVARNGGGLLGGMIAGMLMAVDRNAIFFGTEARPYAGVILAVAVAAWAGAELCSAEKSAGESSAEKGVWWPRIGLLLACFVGFLLHATAAIPLAVLATTVLWWPRVSRSSVYLYFAVAAVMLLALGINAEVIFRVWSDRSQWNAFGRPRFFRELWTIWPWIWLVVVPFGLWIAVTVGTGVRGGRRKSVPAGPAVPQAVHPILAAALLATAIAWGVSCLDIAPIWHRRFMVGVLPLLCWVAGGYWGASFPAGQVCNQPKLSKGKLTTCPRLALAVAVAVGALMFSQGTLAELLAGDRVLVTRGEDWRGAVAFLNQRRQPADPVFVGAELLESSGLDPQPAGLPEPSPGMIEYLRYPVSGPYHVEDAIPLGRQAEPIGRQIVAAIRSRKRATEPSSVWVLLRRGESQSRTLLGRVSKEADFEAFADSRSVHPFGGVTLVRYSVAAGE